MGVADHSAGDGRDWPASFSGGVETVAGYVLLFAVVLTGVNMGAERLLGPGSGFVDGQLYNILWKVVEAGIALAFLRYEGVDPREIGLAPRLVRPALAVAVGLLVGLNAIAVGLVLAAGEPLSVGFFADLRAPPLNYGTVEVLVGMVSFYLFVAPSEELAFRGYLQNKLIDLLWGAGDRLRTALGIVAAGVLFSLAHVPRYLVDGAGLGVLGPALALLVFSGIGFGIVYELTRNLYVVIVLHAFGNWWPLFVEVGAWPHWPLISALYLLMVAGYRHWALDTNTTSRGTTV